jgi:hypothetical protein
MPDGQSGIFLGFAFVPSKRRYLDDAEDLPDLLAPPGIGLKSSKGIGLGSIASALMTNGEFVSNGQAARRKMLRLWTTTDERKHDG